MLSPPSYGGNPNGIGWQWLEHKAGFPLPEKGQRYFELPKRATAKAKTTTAHNLNSQASIPIKTVAINTKPLTRSHKA
jgi:hypothetical protein